MHRALSPALLGVMILAVTAGCDSGPDFRDCSAEDIGATATLPKTLSAAGLYSDITAGAVAAEVVEFTPRFPLWTDGAKKRRWLRLPAGGKVDTSQKDDWDFPVGTQFYKEFTRDGVRVETRLNLRTESGWAAAAYIWRADGSDADIEIAGKENVLGTAHDVPGARQCLSCHGGRRNFSLGFSATQLPEGVRKKLLGEGVLTDPVEGDLALDQAASEGLGFLHANCSHCHNADRSAQPQATGCYDPDLQGDRNFDFTLPYTLAGLAGAPAVKTGRDVLGTPSESNVLNRIRVRNLDPDRPSMPPLGTELVTESGVAAVEALIASLAKSGL